MTRKCQCSGQCGPQPEEVSRREFLEVVGIGTVGALLAGQGGDSAQAAAIAPEPLERWMKGLFEPAPPTVYSSETHADARMHLGGIGTGNVEIGSDGQFTTWQLFNTLRDGEVPFSFLIRAGGATKLLQTRGGPDWRRVGRIEMVGEYPIARLRFLDDALPVGLELEAFSPFAPLDTRLSSLPAAVLVFRVHNPTKAEQEVSLAGLMLNPVGYDALGTIAGRAHPNFGGNVNEVFHEAGATGLVFRAETGPDPALDRTMRVVTPATLKGLASPPRDWPEGLRLDVLDRPPNSGALLGEAPRTVIWFEDAPADLPAAWLQAAKAAVEAGATLVFSGRDVPLLRAYAAVTQGKPLGKQSDRPDILLEDFEHGYENWRVDGTAFGARPAAGTLPGQQPVSGFEGKGLVNSFVGGDDTTGRLVGRQFAIERSFLRFLVGGGSFAETQVRLIVDGKAVRAASGRDRERLAPVVWDVSEFSGKQAHLEIVDAKQGRWGHVNVDQIVLTDRAGDPAAMEQLETLLPARFRAVTVKPNISAEDRSVLELIGMEPREASGPGTVRGLSFLRRRIGKGSVVLAMGPVLPPEQAGMNGPRHRAFADLCALAGARYTAPAGVSRKAPGFGTLALATLAQDATILPDVDNWERALRRFADAGRFDVVGQDPPGSPSPVGQSRSGAVAARVVVAPGATVEVPFVLSWAYPNKYNEAGTWIGCHYASLWPDAASALREIATGFAAAREKTGRFHRSLYDSTLPYWLLDCLTSQVATIRHIGVVFRVAAGEPYGWEGSNGCCQPTCTHVWGYEQTLARLFPDLEREMRRIDFHHQQRPDGGINNRTEVPSPPRPTGEKPFTDGHASCVLKAYREALNHPDDSWLRAYWPNVRRAVEYLIARDAAGSGGEASGILQDEQWNTYDEALHGVTSFLSGYYLAALRAGEEWALQVGERASADRFRAVFEKGRENLQKLCWNGEYFEQKLDDYLKRPGEVGPGCMSDQLIGQWWAHQLGLGYLLPRERVQSALRAVFRHNWKPDLTGWRHAPRAFAGAADRGLIICTWPRGGRPDHVMLYSDEVWTGIEYQVAAHLIYEGMIEEAFAIIKGARDRYDGRPRPPIPRNPWNEIECGGHYARAMSSWSILLALSGYEYDGPAKALTFAPRITPEDFRAFFCGPEGWGSLHQRRDGQGQRNTISVAEGRLPLAELHLAVKEPPKQVKVVHKDAAPAAKWQVEGNVLTVKLDGAISIEAGERFEVVLS
jgi:uncharacterized protein (DUF608 family)